MRRTFKAYQIQQLSGLCKILEVRSIFSLQLATEGLAYTRTLLKPTNNILGCCRWRLYSGAWFLELSRLFRVSSLERTMQQQWFNTMHQCTSWIDVIYCANFLLKLMNKTGYDLASLCPYQFGLDTMFPMSCSFVLCQKENHWWQKRVLIHKKWIGIVSIGCHPR